MIPVTIVTGALGSGKTTFVNYVLTAEHWLKVGVIVNEFGDLAIDNEIIVASEEDMIELPNGCICCTVRGDLMGAVKQLIGTGKVDYLLIETSGVAEIEPVAQTFDLDEMLEIAEVDGVICVIDAENYDENMQRNRTATEQLRYADIVLLNKVDLVDSDKVSKIKEDIKEKVPKSLIIETEKCQADLKLLLGVGKYEPEKRKTEWKRKEHEHAHDPGFDAVSCKAGAVDHEKVQEFLDNLPDNIFRAKGIVCIKESQTGKEDELRVIFNKVGKRTYMEFSRPWKEGEEKHTTLVFIGNNLNKEELQKKLDECN